MTLDPRITFSRASTGTYFDSAGVLQTAATNAPRFDYDPVTHAARGLLIEESRANACAWSEDFSGTGWTVSNATATVNATTAPNGTTTADSIAASAAAAQVFRLFNLTTGTVYAQSIYAKKNTSDWFFFGANDGAVLAGVYFNLAAGTVGTVVVGSGSIAQATMQSVGNGWYRCSFLRTGTAAATNENFQIVIVDANNGSTATIGKSVYVWGAQMELGGFPTSYIPTVGTANVTRAADIAVMTGSNFSSWYNATGTFAVEFDMLGFTSGQTTIMMADNGASTTEYVRFYKPSGTTTLRVSFVAAGASAADLNRGTLTVGPVHKWAASWATNDFAASFNASAVAVDTTGAVPAPNQLRIGTDNLSQYINGHLRKLKFFNVAKTDAELQALTA